MKLQLVSGGKCFAGLAVDLNMLLLEVCEKIESDLQDFMPSSFKFLDRNIPLGANQESTLTLLHCVEKSDVGARLCVLHFKESSESTVETTKSKLCIFVSINQNHLMAKSATCIIAAKANVSVRRELLQLSAPPISKWTCLVMTKYSTSRAG